MLVWVRTIIHLLSCYHLFFFLRFTVSLFRQKKDVLEDGIEKAKRMLTCIFKQVQAALDMHQVVSAGPFVYLVLQEVQSMMLCLIIKWWTVISSCNWFLDCCQFFIVDASSPQAKWWWSSKLKSKFQLFNPKSMLKHHNLYEV